MKKIILFAMIFSSFFSLAPSAAVDDHDVKAAFIRSGDLWILLNGKELQITATGKVFGKPEWSRDGMWIAYQQHSRLDASTGQLQTDLWIYNHVSGENKRIFQNGSSPQWAPHKNMLAFTDLGTLNISTLQRFYNISSGVNDYAWFPDGSGFLLTASGTLRPDGWSSATFFTKKIGENLAEVNLFSGAEPFFTLPREIGTTAQNKVIAVFTEQITYSSSGKWVSFIVSPTASWSMDSNMLCVIGSDGKNFEVLDEIVLEVGSPKWAPASDTIAFIAGGGRIVFGFKNKDLKVKELPVIGSITPQNYADLDFTWITNKSLASSRIKEQEWTNDFSKHPLPTLYTIDITTKEQTKITSPPNGFGDYAPQFIPSIDKLVWLRGTSLIDNKRTLWKANRDGKHQEEWLKNIEEIVFYQK